MTVSETIILGIATGIITSVLIAVAISIFNNIVIPWYRKTIYSGVDISGEWTSILENREVKETAILTIVQKADRISCIMTISVHHSTNNIEIKTYKMAGEFEDRFLSLRGKNINNKHIGIDVMLLQIVNGGNKMVGQETWFSTAHDKIDTESVVWVRT